MLSTQQYTALLQRACGLPAVKRDRLRQLRQMIRRGSYTVNEMELSRRIVEEALSNC